MRNASNDSYKEEWKDMPEFVQENLMPVKSIKINFASINDMNEFSKLIGQKLTDKTKSVWFPKQNYIKPSEYRYIDES